MNAPACPRRIIVEAYGLYGSPASRRLSERLLIFQCNGMFQRFDR